MRRVADLLRRLGHTTEAARTYDLAITRTHNATERDFLRRNRQALSHVRWAPRVMGRHA